MEPLFAFHLPMPIFQIFRRLHSWFIKLPGTARAQSRPLARSICPVNDERRKTVTDSFRIVRDTGLKMKNVRRVFEPLKAGGTHI